MDGLSVASSIAGIISLADVVFVRVTKYVKAAKNADKEVKELAQECLLLTGAVHSLSKLTQVFEAEGLKDQSIHDLRMHHISACHATLENIAKKLKKLEDNPVKRKLVWPFTSEQTKGLLEDISRHKANINLALTADSLSSLLHLLSKDKELQRTTEETLEEVKKTKEIVARIQLDSQYEGRRSVINFFLKYNPQQNYEMSLRLRHPRTGLWLTFLPQFTTWLENIDSKLWLSGIPGAGKTVLAGTVIEEALKQNSDEVATAFFFCDYKNGETQTPVNVLSTIASQLAIQKEEAYVLLETYFNELHPSRALTKTPSVPVLQRVLKDMMKSFDRVFLVVDGLDECGEQTGDVMEALLDIFKDSDNISAAFLSRDEDDIRGKLVNTNENPDEFDEPDFMRIEIAAHTQDVTEYVTAEIEKRLANRTLHFSGLSLKAEVIDGLVTGAKGMFRWVTCQLDRLQDCLSDHECRDALKRLPSTLSETYKRILIRVPKEHVSLVQMILNFIAYAWPKLNVYKLREALSTPCIVDTSLVLDANRLIHESSITKLCRSLIRKSNDMKSFEFAHFSVQEFLKSGMMSDPELKPFEISKSTCNRLLAIQCLNYLQLKNFDHEPKNEGDWIKRMDTIDGLHPFYSYAARYWPVYARDEWTEQPLIDSATSLFHQQKTGNFVSWVVTMCNCLIRQDAYLGDRVTKEVRNGSDPIHWRIAKWSDPSLTPLHVAAALSLPVVCSILLQNGVELNQQSPFGTPFQCVVQGMLPVLVCEEELLLSKDYWYDRSIIRSFYSSDRNPDGSGVSIKTIEYFVRAGQDLQITCTGPFSCLSLISVALCIGSKFVCNLNVASTLIRAGACLEEDCLEAFENFTRNMARKYIPDYGLEDFIVSLKGRVDQAPIHSRIYQMAWIAAIKARFAFTLDPLIMDTTIYHTEDYLRQIIFASCKEGNIEVLEHILQDPRILQMDLFDISGRSPYRETIFGKNRNNTESVLSVFRVLLGANCSELKPDRGGWLPVHYLAELKLYGDDDDVFNKFGDIVRNLSCRGVGCHSRLHDGKTVLHAPPDNWIDTSRAAIKAFLEFDTEDNVSLALRTKDDDGYTPFPSWLSRKREDIALLLLETGRCSLETQQSPIPILSLCAMAGTQKIFEALIEAGVGYDSALVDGDTPLHHVGEMASLDFVRRLKVLYPNAGRLRVNKKIPLDNYLEQCMLSCSKRSQIENHFRAEVLEALAEDLDQKEKKLTLESFMVFSVRVARQQRYTLDRQKTENIVSDELRNLERLGFAEAYEDVTQRSCVLAILDVAPQDNLSDTWNPYVPPIWPISEDIICHTIRKTSLWDINKENPAILSLLKLAVASKHIQLVALLLEKGVSVHQRLNDISAIEQACLNYITDSDTDRMYIFRILVDHADRSRIDEECPSDAKGKSLVHFLVGDHRRGQLQMLLEKGADPNRRIRYKNQYPAIVYHLDVKSVDTAMMLLKYGANPTTSSTGYDAALAAARAGSTAFLTELLRMDRSKNWNVNWEATTYFVLNNLPGHPPSINLGHGLNALHIAAMEGHLDVLEFYLENNLLTNFDVFSELSFTPVHIAVLKGHLNILSFLCGRGASINTKTKDGRLPLHFAVIYGRLEVIKYLIDEGSDMDKDKYGMSPMAYGYQSGSKPIVDYLAGLENQLTQSVKVSNEDQAYAFGRAILDEELQFCDGLVSGGVSLDEELPNSFNNLSPLIYAIHMEKPKSIKWLLDQGADPTRHPLSFRPLKQTSAVNMMVERPRLHSTLPNMLEKFHLRGGEVLEQTPNLIWTAVRNNNNAGLRSIIDHIKKYEIRTNESQSAVGHPVLTAVNQPDIDSLGLTALHMAAYAGDVEAATLLLENGADVNALDDSLKTPLQIAILSEIPSSHTVALLLLQQGVAIESQDSRGDTALIMASSQGNITLVRLLKEAGANVHHCNQFSETPLHYSGRKASQLRNNYANRKVFAFLLSNGANVHQQDIGGHTPIHYAMDGHQCTSLLLNTDICFSNSPPMPWKYMSITHATNPIWLTDHFFLYMKKLGLETFCALANTEPTGTWTPLCKAASNGFFLVMENLLRLGAKIDFEGCPQGSALMAACHAGRIDAVKFLVRKGAKIYYEGPTFSRSAITAAKRHKSIVNWLLVGHFTEQPKLTSCGGISGHQDLEVKSWAGLVKVKLRVSDSLERRGYESIKDYLFRFTCEKRCLRGRTAPLDSYGKLSRPFRVSLKESVRICPGDYGTPSEGAALGFNWTKQPHTSGREAKYLQGRMTR